MPHLGLCNHTNTQHCMYTCNALCMEVSHQTYDNQTWPLSRTIPSGARHIILFCWWLRHLVTFCFMAPCINVLTNLLTYSAHHQCNAVPESSSEWPPDQSANCREEDGSWYTVDVPAAERHHGGLHRKRARKKCGRWCEHAGRKDQSS